MPRTQTTADSLPVARAADSAGRADRQWPIVVLAYAYSGAVRIQRLLSGSPVLACTSGTGLLSLCDHAAATWRRVDNRDGSMSRLAVTSIRALASGMINVILASEGKPRWCEIAFSPPAAAETFLQLYAETRFICLHRSCPDVIRAAARANPWGLADTGLEQFAAAYPGSIAAAIAAYWAECTEALLAFQETHLAACRRLKYEDLAAHPVQEAREVFAFLDLDATTFDDLDTAIFVATQDEAAPRGEASAPLAQARVPFDHLPRPLTERVNGLQVRLGYPPIG